MFRRHLGIIAAALALLLLAALPALASGYQIALAISLLNYSIMAVAWGMFSGLTRYVSLATAAFFGLGAYFAAVFGEAMPWAAILLGSAIAGAAIAWFVGLSTLRLSGIYFVIFSFGLAELIRQVVAWYEVTVTKSVGRFLFLSFSQEQIYWQLVILLVLIVVIGTMISRSRYGFALRLIGEDEVAARHAGVDTTRAKLFMFVVSSVFVTLVGTIMAPRWTYVDPAIAFNPLISFMVVIMALLGGTNRLLTPLLGAIPLVLLFEVLTASFPNYFSIAIGLIFIVIVYFLPHGVSKLLEDVLGRFLGPIRPPQKVRFLPASVESKPFQGRLKWGPPVEKGKPLLEVTEISKRFGGLLAVNNLTMTVNAGEIIGLIGPNGSGKTTALNLISAAFSPDMGSMKFKGRSIERLSAFQTTRAGISRTFQLVRVFRTMTCAENVAAGLTFYDDAAQLPARPEVESLLDRVGLGGKGDVRADQLTYIDQKRLELARALAQKPELLLLDEWLAGLNPSELQIGISLIRSLQQDGLTIIMVEHVMDAIRSLCDRCVVMNVGRKIADGPPAEVLVKAEVIQAYLGEERA